MLILKSNFSNALKLFSKSNNENIPLIFPTDTIYGIGAFINNLEANKKIYEIKGRENNKPFPILIGNLNQLYDLIEQKISIKQEKILKNIWPGKFTIIFKANKNISNLFTLNGNIAVRYIELDWLQEMINYFNLPLSATSANISGKTYVNSIGQIIEDFNSTVKYFLFSNLKNKISSTILDFSSNEIKFLRNPMNLNITDIYQE